MGRVYDEFFELKVDYDNYDGEFACHVLYNVATLHGLIRWRDWGLRQELEGARYISERLELIRERGYELDAYSVRQPFKTNFVPARRVHEFLLRFLGGLWRVRGADEEIDRYYYVARNIGYARYLGAVPYIEGIEKLVFDEYSLSFDDYGELERMVIERRGRRVMVFADFIVLGVEGDVQLFDEFEKYVWLYSLVYSRRTIGDSFIVLDRLARGSREELLEIADVLLSLLGVGHCVGIDNRYASLLHEAFGWGRRIHDRICFYGVADDSPEIRRKLVAPLVRIALDILDEVYG